MLAGRHPEVVRRGVQDVVAQGFEKRLKRSQRLLGAAASQHDCPLYVKAL